MDAIDYQRRQLIAPERLVSVAENWDGREGSAQEQAVVGETPNLAARLQALAEPGQIVLAGATRRLIGDLFRLRDLGPRAVKGFTEPVEAFAVEGVAAAESRFEALYRSTNRDADAHAALAPAVEGFPPARQFPELAEAQTLLSALNP